MSRNVLLVTSLGFLALSGCGPADTAPAVKTIPVTGKVLDADGKPVSGGMLSLRDVKNAEQVASSMVDDDGAFKLKAVVGDKQVEGALAGEYTVLYAPDSVDQTSKANGLPVTLKKKYSIKEGQEELEIKLE